MLVFFSTSHSQDLSFSQFYASPIYLNPAFAGIHQANKFCLQYRNQYYGYKSYTGYAFSFDKYIDALHGGIGVQLIKHDEAGGILQNQGLSVCYAYQNVISKKIAFHASLEAGYNYQIIDFNKLIVLNQIDPLTGNLLGSISAYENIPAKNSKAYPDFGTGVLLYNQNFFAGLAFKHLNSPDVGLISANKLPMMINLHGGYMFRQKVLNKEDAWYFTPTLLYNQQGSFKEINLGFYTGLKNFFGGINFRTTLANRDAVILLIGYTQNNLRLGYSFDYNVETKFNNLRITHEVALSYTFSKERNGVPQGFEEANGSKQMHRRIKCPKFFK